MLVPAIVCGGIRNDIAHCFQPAQSQFVDDAAEVHKYPAASSKHKHDKEPRAPHSDDTGGSSQQVVHALSACVDGFRCFG